VCLVQPFLLYTFILQICLRPVCGKGTIAGVRRRDELSFSWSVPCQIVLKLDDHITVIQYAKCVPEKDRVPWDSREERAEVSYNWRHLARFVTSSYLKYGNVSTHAHSFQLRKELRLSRAWQFCNVKSLEMEAGGLWIWGQPQLHSKFEASLDYLVRPSLKKQKF
jgi:hypothetical protein